MTTVFPYTFKILSQADILVTVDGVVKILTTDYTVSGAGVDGGGNVTMMVAPANGTVVTRRRAMTYTRTVDYQDQGELATDVLDDDQDAPILMIQQLDEGLSRAITVSPDSSGVDLELPSPTALSFLRWNTTGDALENALLADVSLISLSPYAQTLLDAINAAAARLVLGAAKSGANSDITSLTGLTMPLSKAQGGTGIATARTLAQIQSFSTGAVATGTTLIPIDDTIPQITEGDQYMSLAFTPVNAASTLEIDVVVFGCGSVINNYLAACLFQDAISNALAAGSVFQSGISWHSEISFKFIVSAATVTARTYRVRAGGSAAGTFTFNGSSGGRFYGGALASSITVKEYLP